MSITLNNAVSYGDSITINWTYDVSQGSIQGFEIQYSEYDTTYANSHYSTPGDFDTPSGQTNVLDTAREYTFSGLKTYTTYYFHIRTVESGGQRSAEGRG